MSCVYFLSDVFCALHLHGRLHFDLAAGCYSGETQELASVKIVLDNVLPNFWVFLVVVCLGVLFYGLVWGFFNCC